jgi:hypothetical protein
MTLTLRWSVFNSAGTTLEDAATLRAREDWPSDFERPRAGAAEPCGVLKIFEDEAMTRKPDGRAAGTPNRFHSV